MKLREYIIKVKTKRPFTQYCKENGYELIDEYEQTNDLYKCNELMDAKIVINNSQGIIKKFLDIQDHNNTDIVLDNNSKITHSFIDEDRIINKLKILNYEKKETYKGSNIVYKKDNVRFNIIEYTQPIKKIELAIIGKKSEVNNIIFELKKYIIALEE